MKNEKNVANVIELKKPVSFVEDPLTDILRSGARQLLAEALEAEIEAHLSKYKKLKESVSKVRESGIEIKSSLHH